LLGFKELLIRKKKKTNKQTNEDLVIFYRRDVIYLLLINKIQKGNERHSQQPVYPHLSFAYAADLLLHSFCDRYTSAVYI
jgi:hypothetical protein